VFDRNNTVFLLGAGASWHYGYPTGADLVRKVLDKAEIVRSFCDQAVRSPAASAVVHFPKYLSDDASGTAPSDGLRGVQKLWDRGRSEVEEFISRLSSVDPLVMDYFLGINPPLQTLGKLLIAWVLLECEARYKSEKGNINRRDALLRSPEEADRLRAKGLNLSVFEDNWYRFLVHKLITNCNDSESLLSNKVQFITFNYDVSLEHHLFKALSAIALFEKAHVTEFLEQYGRFIHIYGKIRSSPFVDPPKVRFPSMLTPRPRPNPLAHEEVQLFQDYKTSLDIMYEASTGLLTIAPSEKAVSGEVEAAREALRKANCVYILGYGFDENNSNLLKLPTTLKLKKGSGKVVMFTNFRDINLVNKNASRVFFRRNDQLLSGEATIVGEATGNYLLEKSIRDVYGALALDFDSPEERLTSSTAI